MPIGLLPGKPTKLLKLGQRKWMSLIKSATAFILLQRIGISSNLERQLQVSSRPSGGKKKKWKGQASYTPLSGQNCKQWHQQKHWWGRGAAGTLPQCWWEWRQMVQPLWERFGGFLTGLNILLPYDPAFTPLGVYPGELNTSVLTKTCPRMFPAALFIMAQTWKQTRCPSVG